MKARSRSQLIPAIALVLTAGAAPTASAQDAAPPPAYLRDRGTGIATSMFGTYIRPGELIVYPIFEGYVDHDLEYKPEEFGYPGEVDLRGRYRAAEGLLFWHLARFAFVRLNSGFGVTSKATDWAPEVGIVFTVPVR